jgi:adenylate kinase
MLQGDLFKHHRQWPTLASSSQLSTGVADVHAAVAEPEGYARCLNQSCTQKLQITAPNIVFVLEVCPATSQGS